MIESIRKKIEGLNSEDNLIYLIHKINNLSGFCFYMKKIIFISLNVDNLPYKSLETIFLSLKSNIKIERIEYNSSLKSGYYNVIFFNNSIYSKEFETFIYLCNVYANDNEKLKFDDFFFKISSLFQIKKDEVYTNLIGFFGEIFTIRYFYKNYNLCLIDFWHVVDSFDKYDICINNKICIEVKTTTKEQTIFKIKHDQIFNENQIFIITLNIQEAPNGESIYELINDLNKNDFISSNINFQIKIEEEKMKLDYNQATTKKFIIKKILLYTNKNLITIDSFPNCISNIQYDYFFEEKDSISFNECIKQFKASH